MSIKKYKLSSQPIEGDIISENIFKERDNIYWNMKNFQAQATNDGIFAENMFRLILDGINLNHLSKNHPHVDIAIENPIPGFSQENEIISVKSSISKRPTLKNLISDTKSIKLDSMFSYLLFANSNFELQYERDFFKPRKLLAEAIRMVNEVKDDRTEAHLKVMYKKVVNITAYYLMKKNKPDELDNFLGDIGLVIESEDPNQNQELCYGNYNSIRIQVLRRIAYQDAPISLGALYLKDVQGDLTCFIYKTNPIKLSRYWETLVDIWLDEGFFSFETTKYLNLELVKKLFSIPDEENFPIQIEISLGGYERKLPDHSDKSEREKVAIAKDLAKKRTRKLYVATKFKNTNFGDNQEDVNKYFIKTIDILSKKPNLVTRFDKFADTVQEKKSIKL